MRTAVEDEFDEPEVWSQRWWTIPATGGNAGTSLTVPNGYINTTATTTASTTANVTFDYPAHGRRLIG